MNKDQVILIDKPSGISSFGVVAKVRRRLTEEFGHKVKVGHTGTLDPFATGLLILLSGKYTKKSNEFLKLDKVYEATMKLGYISSTGDPEGEITKYDASVGGGAWGTPDARSRQASTVGEKATTGPAQNSSVSASDGAWGSDEATSVISSFLNSFIGKITQTPPRFSAIKINGQRAYKLARQGKTFNIPSRQVEIYSIDILNYNYPYLTIRVHCSSGTYIRTLAEDIGKALGTGAYLTALRRTKIGQYSVTDATKL